MKIVRCKAKKKSKGNGNVKNAKSVRQGVSVDWGFVTINSNQQVEQLTGLNGESTVLVVVDHKSNHFWGHALGYKPS